MTEVERLLGAILSLLKIKAAASVTDKVCTRATWQLKQYFGIEGDEQAGMADHATAQKDID